MKKKRNKEIKFRHKVVGVVAKTILWPIIKIKYRYKYTYYKNLKKTGPYLIIGNHTVAFDPILMGLSFPFHLYYFASEQIFNLGFLSKMLVYLVNPISKSKGNSDVNSIKKAKRIVNEGGSIGLYPEGNVTYDGALASVNKSIVKLVRLLGIDILIYTTRGLYLSDARWTKNRKKGKTSGSVTKVIKKEEYDQMSNEELTKIIIDALSVNAYSQQEELLLEYKGRKMAEGLERLVFMDLNTDTPFVTYTKNNELKSHVSDFKLIYDKYGYVTNELGIKKTLVEINKEVINSYLKYYNETDKELLFTEKVLVDLTSKDRKINKGNNTLDLYKDKVVINFKHESEELLFSEISSLTIQGKKKIIVNGNGKMYLITFNLKSSPYKYLLTYQFYKKGIENDNTSSFQQFGL